MIIRQVLYSTVAAMSIAAFSAALPQPSMAQQAAAVAIDGDDIGGVVTGQSSVFSGDIVAISGDGRAFKRTRVVIDASAGSGLHEPVHAIGEDGVEVSHNQ